MDTIKFANGAVYSCPHLATLPELGIAYVALDDVTFAEAAQIFSNPEMTSVMEFGDWRLVGYTACRYVMRESYGFKACLEGGHDEPLN